MKFEFNKEYKLENDRVRIRPLTKQNAEELRAMALSEIDLLQFSPPEMHTNDKFNSYINALLNRRIEQNGYPLLIFDKLKNNFAGTSSFLNVSVKNERLEIGSTWIGSEFQRTGLNRNCKYLLLQFAFEQLNAKRVELKTDARNAKSRKAIIEIGAKFEGILRSHTVMSDGFRRDTVYFSILANEWPELKRNFRK